MKNKITKTEVILSQLGAELASDRKDVGLSQSQVASELGYTSAQFVSNFERGLICPPLATLKKLVKLYSVSEEHYLDNLIDLVIAKYRDA